MLLDSINSFYGPRIGYKQLLQGRNKLLFLKQKFGSCLERPTSGNSVTGAVTPPPQSTQFLKLVSPTMCQVCASHLTTRILHSSPFNFPVTQYATAF